jgi:hypothetical protein
MIHPRCLLIVAIACVTACDSHRTTEAVVRAPDEVFLFPSVAIDDDERIVSDSNIGSGRLPHLYAPDTMAVLAPGETFRASAKGYVWMPSREVAITLVSTDVIQAVTWSSDNAAVASVNHDGIVTAHRAGTATIKASSPFSDVSASAKVRVLAKPLRFTQLSAGAGACGLTTDGEAYCWGDEPHIGEPPGFLIENVGPHLMVAPERFTMLSAGEWHFAGPMPVGQTCALGESGRVYCWGTGTFYWPAVSPVATPIEATATFKTVAVGGLGACALDTDGNAYCWGLLGGSLADPDDPEFRNAGAPSLVPGGLHFKSISVGTAACGIVDDGTAYCWSTNPKALAGGVTFTQLDVATAYACGVSVDHDLYCWGQSPMGGLGLGSTTDVSQPTLVPGGLKFASVTVGKDRENVATCGLTVDGAAYCWGDNEDGVLGIAGSTGVSTPTAIASSLRFSTLVSGSFRACGLANDKTYCWGRLFGRRADAPYLATPVEGQGP